VPASEHGAGEARLAQAALQKIATFVRGLSPEEISDLARGRAKLSLVREADRKKPRAELRTDDEVARVIATLRRYKSRSDGDRLLQDVASSRAALTQLANALDVPIPKTDTVERLRERVVDATIGYRLRSEAIRGSITDKQA